MSLRNRFVLMSVLAALAVPTVQAQGYEADDVIATLAVQADAQDMDVLVVTGDRDVDDS